MGLRMKISILWGLTEKSDFYGGGGGGGVRKTNISGGGLDSLTLNIFHTLF